MDIYNVSAAGELLASNSYPGRGIILGLSSDGRCAVYAYFIMGRSENSRNRVFTATEGDSTVTIYPFDESKVEDPSLIIYSPVRRFGSKWIVTNGDQTDTVYDALVSGKSFEDALDTRCFEPDAPNFTPRISGIIDLTDCFSYKMSILKSADALGSACNRYTYSYSPLKGLGHFIHTYQCDGKPIPTFQGEPERVKLPATAKELFDEIWTNLNPDNKVSLAVSYVDLVSGKEDRIIANKHQEK